MPWARIAHLLASEVVEGKIAPLCGRVKRIAMPLLKGLGQFCDRAKVSGVVVGFQHGGRC